jgi:hypothetical protein
MPSAGQRLGDVGVRALGLLVQPDREAIVAG